MKFWDASAMIPLCLEEPRTPRVRDLIEEDPGLVAWWASPVECFSAFARLRREGVLTRPEEEQARHVLASDSLQLAAALVFSPRRSQR